MRFHNITKDDMLNGEGLRVVLWVSGCSHGCKGCHNPITWDENSGVEFDDKAKKELLSYLSRPYITGLTLSGGDPLFGGNKQAVFALAKEVKTLLPNKNIWLYTGYVWEDICDFEGLENIDVVVDGPFVESEKDTRLMWRGSKNQRVIDVKRTQKEQKLVFLA